MTIYNKVKNLSLDKSNETKLKYYLLDCCLKYKGYRSSGYLEKGVAAAKKYIKGYSTWKDLHKIEWYLEGEAFGIDFYKEDGIYGRYPIDKCMLSDLCKVRINKQLNQKEAVSYLQDLAYFITMVISFCIWGVKDLPDQKFERFLCPVLFKKHFKTCPAR